MDFEMRYKSRDARNTHKKDNYFKSSLLHAMYSVKHYSLPFKVFPFFFIITQGTIKATVKENFKGLKWKISICRLFKGGTEEVRLLIIMLLDMIY